MQEDICFLPIAQWFRARIIFKKLQIEYWINDKGIISSQILQHHRTKAFNFKTFEEETT